MDKISGILPSSSRVAAVDMKESGPVRPGTPSFGRPEGISSLRDAKVGQTASRAVKISQEQLDWRSKDMQNAATVRELSDKFFQGHQKSATDQKVESVVANEMNIAPLAAARPSLAEIEVEIPMAESTQPEGLHPRGTFVDVQA